MAMTIENSRKIEKLTPVFYLFLFYIMVWWLQLGGRLGKRFGTEIRLEAVIAVMLLLATYLDAFRRKTEEKSGFTPYVAVYFVVLLLQVLIAWNTDRAWGVYIDNVLKYSVMGLLISRFVRTPQQLRWLVFVWLLACWKGTLEGVVGGITGSLIWENQGVMRLNGNGLWAHPNSFSQFALGAIPFCFYLYPLLKKNWMKAGLISLFCFATYVVIYTGSRTGYLGYLFMLILFYFQSSKVIRKRLFVALLIVTPVTLMVMPASYQERFMSSFSGKEKEGNSKGARIALYEQGLSVFIKYPFGVGVGNYREANQLYYGRAMDQHNLYLESLTELGIHGALVFAFLLIKIDSVIRTIISKTSQADDEDARLVNAVARSLYLYFCIRLFLDLFSMDLYGIAWWFIIGIASSMGFIVSKMNLETKTAPALANYSQLAA